MGGGGQDFFHPPSDGRDAKKISRASSGSRFARSCVMVWGVGFRIKGSGSIRLRLLVDTSNLAWPHDAEKPYFARYQLLRVM